MNQQYLFAQVRAAFARTLCAAEDIAAIRCDYPDLTEGQILLAEGFLQKLIADGLIDDTAEYQIEEEVQGLTIAAGLGYGKRRNALQLANYVWRRLGLAPWTDCVAAAGEQPRCQDRSLTVTMEDRDGHLYILRNHSLPGLLKIGFTRKSVAVRLDQLSRSTAIPTPFELVASFACRNPFSAEQEIHSQLSETRVPGKEFFRLPEEQAVEVCRTILRGAE